MNIRTSYDYSHRRFTGNGFSDVATKKRITPTHPGDILLHDLLEPLSMSANALAAALHVPTNQVTGILNHSRGVTADTALRLARYFGNSPEFWLGLQADFDLRTTHAEIGRLWKKKSRRNLRQRKLRLLHGWAGMI